MLNRYEDWADKSSREVTPYYFVKRRWERAWSRRLRFIPTQRRPVLNDGNFRRMWPGGTIQARNERRWKRYAAKVAIRKGKWDDLPFPPEKEWLD